MTMNTTKLYRQLKAARLIGETLSKRGTKTLVNSKLKSENKVEWNTVIKDAERVVGYPTSFLNLRWLLNDEVANIAMHMRRLIRTEHPLLKTMKDYLLKNETPAWGLMILLLSKTAGFKSNIEYIDFDRVAGILHSQRVLAEITEMIRASVMIHKNVLNINESQMDNIQDLQFGNKIALLSGDYLLSKSFKDLASLKNQTANEILSSALRDLSECEFLGLRDEQNRPIPSQPVLDTKCSSRIFAEDYTDEGPYNINTILGYPKEEWLLRNLLHGANLLGKACRAALVFGGHDVKVQKHAYLFGKNVALALQIKSDYSTFVFDGPVNLVSAPIMLHLCKNPELYSEIKEGLKNIADTDFEKIKKIVIAGSTLDETKELKEEFVRRALKNLESFEASDARKALENLVKNI